MLCLLTGYFLRIVVGLGALTASSFMNTDGPVTALLAYQLCQVNNLPFWLADT